MSFKWPSKDSGETLDYSLDWSRFLRTSESLSSVVWSIDDEDGVKQTFTPPNTINTLINGGNTNSSTVATITLSGGTNNATYKLYCTVTLNSGYVAERSVTLRIKER